jgi:hypothetical protein
MASQVAGVWSVDWLNANGQRKYPLHDEATSADTTSSIVLPDDFLVDAVVPINPSAAVTPTLFHLYSIRVFAEGITISLGYNGAAIGSATIDKATFSRNTTAYIQGIGDFYDTVAKVVVGSLDNISQLAGQYFFTVSAGRLSPTVVRPFIRGVSSIALRNGEETGDPVTDDIVFEAGRNAQLILDNTPVDYSRIIFNFIEGAGTVVDCDCREGAAAIPILTINGIEPDANGNFVLEDDACLGLTAMTNGLRLEEKCAKPCCGCDELSVVTERLNHMTQQVNALENLASRLETQMSFLQLNSLG